ncbi:hypothetical protein SFRURICE_000500, partial [Spodoptera frugiperda]
DKKDDSTRLVLNKCSVYISFAACWFSGRKCDYRTRGLGFYSRIGHGFFSVFRKVLSSSPESGIDFLLCRGCVYKHTSSQANKQITPRSDAKFVDPYGNRTRYMLHDGQFPSYGANLAIKVFEVISSFQIIIYKILSNLRNGK